MRSLAPLLLAMTACPTPEKPPIETATVRVSVRGAGQVRSTDARIQCPQTSCAASYDIGAEVTLEATPGVEARLASITGGPAVAASPLRLTVDRQKSLSFDFVDLSSGAVEWCRAIGGDPGEVRIYSMAASDAGRVWVAGTANGTASFGGPATQSPIAAANDPFIAEYDQDGGFLRARRLRVLGTASPRSVVTTATGVAMGGNFTQQIDFGGDVAQASSSSCAAYLMLARYGENLGRAWSNGFGGKMCGTSVVASTPENGTLVSGRVSKPADFGSGPLDATFPVPFLAELDADGGGVRAFALNNAGGTGIANAVAVTPDGGWAIAGNFTTGLIFGGIAVNTFGKTSTGFVAVYTPAGTELWSRVINAGPGATVSSMAIDTNGDVYATGEFETLLALDATVRPSRGISDVWVARFRGDGTLVWAFDLGSEGVETSGMVALTPAGVAISGSSTGKLQFGPMTLPAPIIDDLFVAGLDREGQPRWIRQFSSAGFGRVSALTATSDGALVLGAFSHVTGTNGAFMFDGGVVERQGPICAVGEKSSILVRLRP